MARLKCHKICSARDENRLKGVMLHEAFRSVVGGSGFLMHHAIAVRLRLQT
jgi:hypothetical protein